MENTIIFGNGINRLSDKNISWGHLLDLIKGPRKFNDASLPNTMIYERIILERPHNRDETQHDEFAVKDEISKLMKDIEPNTIYSDLFNLKVQNYLTTNYDYAFINSISNSNDASIAVRNYSTEDVYSIRRLKRISNAKQSNKYLWQIHGEIDRPATIMLGLDHYCGSIGKIDDYIKGGYKYSKGGEAVEEASIEDKFKKGSFTNSSWVELFFTSNIHILSFSLDYSEIDLWWIINKRARMRRSESLRRLIKNKITFHCHTIDEQKMGLLESMDIDVSLTELSTSDTKYLDYHRNLVSHLRRKL